LSVEKSIAERKEMEDKFKAELGQFQNQLSTKEMTVVELQAAIDEFRLRDLSAEEKAKQLSEKKLKETQKQIDALTEQVNQYKNQFEDTKTTNDLLGIVSQFNPVNANQALRELKSFGKVILEKTDSGYETKIMAKIDGEEKSLSPKQAAELFFAMTDNANLLKANIISGGGTSQTTGRSDGKGGLVYKNSELNDPKIFAEFKKKQALGESVQIIN
jgi:predicted RNase H-like nuclease (RuvC/YqgF family)